MMIIKPNIYVLGLRIKKYILAEKQKLLRMEPNALFSESILWQNFMYYHLNSEKQSSDNENINFSQNTRN